MRTASITRATRETKITCTVNLDGTGDSRIATGIGFLDHMLTALSKHSGIDIDLACTGDLHVDDHHTAEDCALTLGQTLDQALASRLGITRFASAYAPLDESLARAVLDLSGRPLAVVNLMLLRDSIGTLATENIPHFFRSLATTLRATLHLDILRGENDHHKAEAAFKALALALRQAIARTASTDVPSTKGSL
ncbi:MAG: imidazoleglycerol-phosphate dehydratase HisB [Tepidisphaera sp.]